MEMTDINELTPKKWIIFGTLFFLYSKMETSNNWAFWIPTPPNVRYRSNVFRSLSTNSAFGASILFIICATPITSPS